MRPVDTLYHAVIVATSVRARAKAENEHDPGYSQCAQLYFVLLPLPASFWPPPFRWHIGQISLKALPKDNSHQACKLLP